MLDLALTLQLAATATLFLFGSYLTYRQRVKRLKRLQLNFGMINVKEEIVDLKA